MKRNLFTSLSLAVMLILIVAPLAFADQVVNNIDTTIDPALEVVSIPVNGSISVGFFIQVTPNHPVGDVSGCNSPGSHPATVNLSVPAGVTANPTSLTFTGCGIVQNVLFGSNTPGSYTISVASVTGGRPGSLWDTAPASFTLNVLPPPNTPPTITVNDVTKEGNTTGGWTLVFSEIGSASDAEDGTPSVACVPPLGSVLPLGDNIVVCTATDSGGLTAMDSGTVKVVDTTPPTISCPVDFSGKVGQPVLLGSPTVSDVVDPSPSVANNAPGSFPPGMTTVTWTATDGSGNSASCQQKVTLTYDFAGFFQPIDNGMLNVAKAGSAIPVKFSLGGNFGLLIFSSGPVSVKNVCDNSLPTDEVPTMTAGSSSLSYDPIADQYVYVWKTDKAWAGTCRQLKIMLNDGTTYMADFRFNK